MLQMRPHEELRLLIKQWTESGRTPMANPLLTISKPLPLVLLVQHRQICSLARLECTSPGKRAILPCIKLFAVTTLEILSRFSKLRTVA